MNFKILSEDRVKFGRRHQVIKVVLVFLYKFGIEFDTIKGVNLVKLTCTLTAFTHILGLKNWTEIWNVLDWNVKETRGQNVKRERVSLTI